MKTTYVETVAGRDIPVKVKGKNSSVLNEDMTFLLGKANAFSRDPLASEKIFKQMDTMLSEGKTLRTMKPSSFPDVKYRTIKKYLYDMRCITEKRECPVNPLVYIRMARKHGALNVLARLTA